MILNIDSSAIFKRATTLLLVVLLVGSGFATYVGLTRFHATHQVTHIQRTSTPTPPLAQTPPSTTRSLALLALTEG